MNELASRLDRVSQKLSKMKAIEEQNHVLKLDNEYLQKKIARLERDNEDMERKIEELTGLREPGEGIFPLHYNGDYDMRLENREMDDQPNGWSEPSKDEPAVEASTDNPEDSKKTAGEPNDSEQSSNSAKDPPFDAAKFKDDDEYQMMMFGFVSKFARKTYVFDPEAESGKEFCEKSNEQIDSKPPAQKQGDEEKTGELVDSASPDELPSSTVCTENEIARLRSDLNKVIAERNNMKTKYEAYKAKYKKIKRRLTKKSSYCKEIKEERNKLKKVTDERASLKAKLVGAERQIEALESELSKLKHRSGRLDRELDEKDRDLQAQQREVVKLEKECKHLDHTVRQYEKSEIVLRRDVQALNAKLNRKRGKDEDCANCLKLENECLELNDMYKRTLELLVFETPKQ